MEQPGGYEKASKDGEKLVEKLIVWSQAKWLQLE